MRKENIPSSVLLAAAQEIVTGKVEADLGGCLFKKRLPRAGGGKRGAYRVIVGYKRPDESRIIFYTHLPKATRQIYRQRKKLP